VPERVPEYSWQGDTGDLLRRLRGPTNAQHVARERCLWFALGTIVALITAALLASWRSEPVDLHVVTTSEDHIMWVSQRRGEVGGCVFEQDRVRCVKTDWISGPLEFE
jgi:hypothetical protein